MTKKIKLGRDDVLASYFSARTNYKKSLSNVARAQKQVEKDREFVNQKHRDLIDYLENKFGVPLMDE